MKKLSPRPICNDGSGHDGILRKRLEVHCRKCGQCCSGLPGDRDEAQAELRSLGWETRLGLWICVNCTFTTPRGTKFCDSPLVIEDAAQ